ncbi:hypothetical protein [Pontibacter indicus]|uniref:Uncharacterized protein n=1 Tax=Pontibacter indicus TaxID=1317125 RepID=A0A1R3XBE8_9BACT|nr:hypothetical protein [Pontibacter indicus]SIT88354.1 hypothetical protein SAMN05444128_1825 [Pontibacter indicus]
MAYTWKYLKIAVLLAAVSFVLDTYLFGKDIEPLRFMMKTALLSAVILLLNEWESRYKQARNAHSSEEKL